MNDKTVKLEDELSSLRVEVVQRREDVEREEFKSQQLLKRVEALQAKQAERESQAQGEKKGFWGMFKGGEGAMKDEYEKLEKMYQVAQEELQVKIEEVELEHQKQAALKLRHETMLEEIGVSKAQCEAQISKLQNDLDSKRLECDGLQSNLDAERQRYTQLFSEIQNLKT